MESSPAFPLFAISDNCVLFLSDSIIYNEIRVDHRMEEHIVILLFSGKRTILKENTGLASVYGGYRSVNRWKSEASISVASANLERSWPLSYDIIK